MLKSYGEDGTAGYIVAQPAIWWGGGLQDFIVSPSPLLGLYGLGLGLWGLGTKGLGTRATIYASHFKSDHLSRHCHGTPVASEPLPPLPPPATQTYSLSTYSSADLP